MQARQKDRTRYFNELAATSEKYFLPYVATVKPVDSSLRVLEIGCGDGGNLLPFAERGCAVVGVDLAASRVETARRCFQEAGLEGTFIAADIFTITELRHQFDLILCHDVLEHIDDKALFLHNLRDYLSPEGVVFMSFPAWQMPFGGHQQICHNRVLSHLPFFHLLPTSVYHRLLRWGGEGDGIIDELLHIKQTRCSIELFERLARREQFLFADRRFYFINPHYEVKFHLKPRRLSPLIGRIPWLRNFFTTSCFYLLR